MSKHSNIYIYKSNLVQESRKVCTATEHFHNENSYPSIPSFSQSLDEVLGNKGLQLHSLTEVLGLPGTGKTQLCLQLCASVQIPKALGGLSAEAFYIDTNTNFTKQRFMDILSASLKHCRELLDLSVNVTEADALKKLHYASAFSVEKFCALLQQMPRFLGQHPEVRLIVIDSLTFPFKDGISAKQRTGLLFRLMADLQRLAMNTHIAVLVTNEMSTRVGLAGGAAVGALGDAWAHRSNTRVLLANQGGSRLALPLKSAFLPSDHVAKFQITHEGIRDVE